MALGEQLQKARLARNLTPSQVAAATHMKVQTVEAIEREDFVRIAAPIYAKGFIRIYAQFVGLDPQPLLKEFSGRLAHDERPALDMAGHAAPARDADATEPAAAGAAAAPVSPVVEAEPDLFARPRRPAKAAAPDAAGPAGGDPEAESLKDRSMDTLNRLGETAREVGRTAAGAVGATGSAMAEKTREVMGSLRERKFDFSGVTVPASPLRVISMAAGVLLLLVFVASVVSRCAHRPAPAAAVAAPAPGDAGEGLSLTVEPPDAYVD